MVCVFELWIRSSFRTLCGCGQISVPIIALGTTKIQISLRLMLRAHWLSVINHIIPFDRSPRTAALVDGPCFALIAFTARCSWFRYRQRYGNDIVRVSCACAVVGGLFGSVHRTRFVFGEMGETMGIWRVVRYHHQLLYSRWTLLFA